jgi:COP9 signalosome complex subunit 1
LEQRSFSHIPTYVFKAESALDSIATPGHSSSSLGYGSSAAGAGGSGSKKIDLHQAVEAKLALCNALSHLMNGNYAKATQDFLQPMSAAALAPWNGTIVSMGDIAVYATLCALATLGRSELKARVIESEGLAGEGDGMKELLDAWMASNFRLVLGLLEKYTVSALISGTLCTVIGGFFFFLVLSFPPDHNASLLAFVSRPVIYSIPYSAHTSGISRCSSVPAQSCSISSPSRRSGLSA